MAQLATQVVGAGGSFGEIQALDFDDGVVEMGHDGPAPLAVSARDPLLRGLGVYHGNRGWGVSVEFDVQPGSVTLLGLGQDADGGLCFVASEGEVVPGPLLEIGNTTSRVDFGRDPGEWVDACSATGIGHHWSLSRVPSLRSPGRYSRRGGAGSPPNSAFPVATTLPPAAG